MVYEANIKVGEIYMTRNGGRCIVIHDDPLTATYRAFHFFSKRVEFHNPDGFHYAPEHSEYEVNNGLDIVGIWQDMWIAEREKYRAAGRAVIPELINTINGGRVIRNSVMAVERFYELPPADAPGVPTAVCAVSHQEFSRMFRIKREQDIIPVLRESIDALMAAIEKEKPDTVVWRVPLDYDIFIDEWKVERVLKTYMRASFIKNNSQVLMPTPNIIGSTLIIETPKTLS